MRRTYLFMAISSIALIIVLAIQVNWIIQTTKIKEELFNEKANMVVTKTAEALSSDEATCMKMEQSVGVAELKKTDSLFSTYMDVYNFHPSYSFEVRKLTDQTPTRATHVYKKRLEEAATKSGLELNLFVPEKKQAIMADMRVLLIASAVLILVVLVLFWQTLRSLVKEKKLSEHTTDFLNNMTHEFKAPLTNIALATKMLLKDNHLQQEDKLKQYTGIILEENEKLRLQVEQVLSMTALERGEIPLRKTVLDMHQLLRDAVKCIQIQIDSAEGSLELGLEAERVALLGDKTHLTNAFCNLIDNAVKYAKGKPEISLKTANSGTSLVITIADKGIGIEKEYQKKIFDKFFRVPTGDIHDVKGFGLGLTYLKKIVELHGGTVSLRSEKGKGAVFTVVLPQTNDHHD